MNCEGESCIKAWDRKREKMLCRLMSKKKKIGAVPVYLNVYDLTPINGYAYWLGLGVYHSGVQGSILYLFLCQFHCDCLCFRSVKMWICL